MLTKHQYLAFDVSLPPPGYLSCSPKQLDSGSKEAFRQTQYCIEMSASNVAVTLLGGANRSTTAAFQRELYFPGCRCVCVCVCVTPAVLLEEAKFAMLQFLPATPKRGREWIIMSGLNE